VVAVITPARVITAREKVGDSKYFSLAVITSGKGREIKKRKNIARVWIHL
jgi:hypothetical protein